MRIEQKLSELGAVEIGFAGDRRKGRRLNYRAALIRGDDVARRAPTTGEPLSMFGVGGEREIGRERADRQHQGSTREENSYERETRPTDSRRSAWRSCLDHLMRPRIKGP